MGLEMYSRRARADGARVEGGAEGCLRAVGSVRTLRCHFAFGAAVVAVLLLNPAVAVSQPEPPASDQRQLPEAATKPPENEAVQHVKVEGFRSAHWGMDGNQVKAAIHKDFSVPVEKVKTEENAAERTTILTATVNDLLEGAGPARISYILGYKTKKLIQVTILWGTPVDPQAQPEKIIAAANQLQQLFLDSSYQPETVVTNARTADGTILVFQGQDADKHTTVLRLANTQASAKGSKAEAAGGSAALSLSYTLDSRSPDIFRLKKGQF
jgi:hypothetical protein